MQTKPSSSPGPTANFQSGPSTYNYDNFPLLASITDVGSGATLLTVSRASATGAVTSVSDCYGRSVYYTEAQEGSVALPSLTHVSQVVPTGAGGPADRYAYGYVTYEDDQAGRQPYLHQITTPSPAGPAPSGAAIAPGQSGTATATINYGGDGSLFVSSLVDADGNTRAYSSVNADGSAASSPTGYTKVAVTDGGGHPAYSQVVGFDSNMSETSVTDGAGGVVMSKAFSDPSDPYRPSSVTDGNGKTTQYTWDRYGNLLTLTPPANSARTPATTTFVWDYSNFALGELIRVQHGSKSATTHTYYEPSGLEQSVNRPRPGTVGGTQTVTTTYTYDSLGNILTMTTPGDTGGSTITTTWNYTTDGSYSQAAAIDQPLTITDNLSNVRHFRYDSRSNRLMEIDASGYETDKTYNVADQLLTTMFPITGQNASTRAQEVRTYLYSDGPLTSTTQYDETGTSVRQVLLSYGLEGELTSVSGSTEPASFAYDALYRKTSVKDGNNQVTRFSYNNAGYLYQTIYPGATSTTPGAKDTLTFTQYDNVGRVLQRVDGCNTITNYTYNDPENLLTDTQYPSSPALNVHYVYDSYGRRSAMVDGTGSQSYSYDDNDALITHQVTYTSLPTKIVSYAFYPSGRVSQMITPAGSFSYGYDADGRMSDQTNPSGETFSWSYYPNDWVKKQTLGDGVTGTYTYNARGWITSLINQTRDGTVLSQFNNLSYDSVGNRTAQAVSVPSSAALSGTTGYTYDSRDELTQEGAALAGGYTEDFTYDGNNAGAGNAIVFRDHTQTYNTDNQNAAYTYDGNGNPTAYKSQALTYDPENRLTQYGDAMTAGYTGDGLRAWKAVTQQSGGVPGGGKQQGVKGGGSNTNLITITQATTYFLYDGTKPICEIDGDSGDVTAVNTFGFEGVVSRHTDAGSVFYALDPQGNAIQRLSSTGGLLSTSLYDGYGVCVGTVGSSPATDPWGYGALWGYYTDIETGLTLLTARYYDPSDGRFLTRDPLGYSGDINLYGYVRNNPVMGYDPLGLQGFDPIGGFPGFGIPWPTPIIPIGTPPFYGYHCGPQDGLAGVGPGIFPAPNADMDACCEDHDDCWAAHGCSLAGNNAWMCPNPACKQCNKQLCNCVNHVHCAWWDLGCRIVAAFVHHTIGGC